MGAVKHSRTEHGLAATEAAPEPIPSGKVTVIPVNGPMLHLELNRWIDGPTPFPAMDGWLQAQLDAGKLVKC